VRKALSFALTAAVNCITIQHHCYAGCVKAFVPAPAKMPGMRAIAGILGLLIALHGCSSSSREEAAEIAALETALAGSEWVSSDDLQRMRTLAPALQQPLDRMIFSPNGTWTWGDALSGTWSVVGADRIRRTVQQKGQNWTADVIETVVLADDRLRLTLPDDNSTTYVRAD
jgi:hypothetical protein